MSRDFLLEIGTEEIPAHAMPGILSQLKEKAQKELEALRLSFNEVKTLGTPRRLALKIAALGEKQSDIEKENRGPSLAVAFDKDGNPTKAAEGFARGQGIDTKDLVQKNGYVYAYVSEKGRAAQQILAEILPELVANLSFPNNMRWGSLEFKFIRPLRWLVALYGDEVIEFTVADVKSGRTSRGHRVLGHESFEFTNASSYEKECEAEFIIVDQERRRDIIVEQIKKVAEEKGGKVEINEELLEEVIYLVEYPTALCGSFEEKYLKLPPEAVITPMRDHQRYFPVKAADGKLMPLFITVRNGGTYQLDTVRHGNERVLRARLADAQFFFDEDRKKSLAEHREKLKTVVFQEGLGTIYDKSERLVKLAGKIADDLKLSAAEKKSAERAALLSKADLVTGMVCEFTELQGIMGKEYALLDGEEKIVAEAIDEHYMPRFAGDTSPSSIVGKVLSLADKIDNLVATFSRGLIPTGSQDPFALRRQALGMVNLLLEAKAHVSLAKLADEAMDLLAITGTEERTAMQKNIADFLRLRLKNVLSGENVRYDVVDAAIEEIDDVYRAYERAKALEAALKESDMTKDLQAFGRVANLAKKDEGATLDESVLVKAEEKALIAALHETEASVDKCLASDDYLVAVKALAKLTAPIDAFFDAVLVMDEDAKIRQSRLALLKQIDTLINRVADFTKIVVQ